MFINRGMGNSHMDYPSAKKTRLSGKSIELNSHLSEVTQTQKDKDGVFALKCGGLPFKF